MKEVLSYMYAAMKTPLIKNYFHSKNVLCLVLQ